MIYKIPPKTNFQYFQNISKYLKAGFSFDIQNYSNKYGDIELNLKNILNSKNSYLDSDFPILHPNFTGGSNFVDFRDNHINLIHTQMNTLTTKVECDAIIFDRTLEHNVYVAPADCPVIFISDGISHAIIHSGRVGTELNIVSNILSTNIFNLRNLYVAISPHISAENYKFNLKFVEKKYNNSEFDVIKKKWGDYLYKTGDYFHFDILGKIIHQFNNLKISDEQMEIWNLDTYTYNGVGLWSNYKLNIEKSDQKRFFVGGCVKQ